MKGKNNIKTPGELKREERLQLKEKKRLQQQQQQQQ